MKKDLHSALEKAPKLDQVKKWVCQLTLGIHALHEIGIIHKDIKPDNVLVDGGGNIRIFDYGTAYIHGKKVTRERKYSDDPRGTIPYLAPERSRDRKERYGPMVDYWALGCTVFTIISFDVSFKFPSSFFV
jgi:serine/threonine protein kinase